MASNTAVTVQAQPNSCVKGQRIGNVSEGLVSGDGTYELKGGIYAALTGFLNLQQLPDNKTSVSVNRSSRKMVAPAVHDLVVTKITCVNARFCKCSIIAIGTEFIREPFHAIIRREDIRATDKDKVLMHNCFRCGDIVLARVISMGDSQAYSLSTAENELGVVLATSEAGGTLVPISWCQMQCSLTMAKENRKVARVQPEFLKLGQS